MADINPRASTKLTELHLMNFKGIRGTKNANGELTPLSVELRPIGYVTKE